MTVASRVRWLPRRPAAPAPRFDPTEFTPQLKTRLLILQPTPFCNIDCDYCYLPQRDSTARMTMATVRTAARRLREAGLLGSELGVVWHAGEPLVMPPAFYDEAVAVLADELGSGCMVSHSIQTNATLIDDAWCALFMRHHIRIGVSVDGPADLHDAHRRTRAGQGTHARVERGLACLRAHGIEFHAIAVVTPATFAQVDAFFDYFAASGVTELGCNFDEAEGLHSRSSLACHEPAHAVFISRLLERSIAGGSRLRVRELASALQRIRHPLPTWRWRGESWPDNAQTLPFAMITVAHDGDFGTFSPELLGQASGEFGNFVLGNVASSGYLDSTRSDRFQRLWAAVLRGNHACEQRCAHHAFCGGGAPANKFYENGDIGSAETLYCRTMVKRPFDAVLARLERSERQVGEGNAGPSQVSSTPSGGGLRIPAAWGSQ